MPNERTSMSKLKQPIGAAIEQFERAGLEPGPRTVRGGGF